MIILGKQIKAAAAALCDGEPLREPMDAVLAGARAAVARARSIALDMPSVNFRKAGRPSQGPRAVQGKN